MDKERVARSFLRGKETYDQHAKVQQKVGRILIEMLGNYPKMRFDRVLEIGCCTGVMTELFLREHPAGTLYLNDLVPEFYEIVCKRFADMTDTRFEPLFGDVEMLDLPSNLDLVLSSSTLQWLVDLPGFFKKIINALNRQGYLAFTIFGPGTLSEFRELTGVGLQYIPLGQVLDLLQKDFVLEFVDTEKHQLFFLSPREVLRHLQATGVGGVGNFRWTSSKLQRFESDYNRRFGSAAGVPVTYVTSYVIASRR
ncbi:MAG: methyltransferase domain-containing protein [Desulfocapsaceae bacterium]|nr:methyltransferase domain-containing protein [Desulfocapsaceae bacterium]